MIFGALHTIPVQVLSPPHNAATADARDKREEGKDHANNGDQDGACKGVEVVVVDDDDDTQHHDHPGSTATQASSSASPTATSATTATALLQFELSATALV